MSTSKKRPPLSNQSPECIAEWVTAIKDGLRKRTTKRDRDRWWAHCLNLAFDRSGGDVKFIVDILVGLRRRS